MLQWAIEDEIDDALVVELRGLWRRAPCPNPFVAPALLKVFGTGLEDGSRPLVAVARTPSGTLAAVWPLRRTRHGQLRFLQDAYSDQRTCLAAPEADVSELAAGLGFVARTVGATSLALTNVPAWGPTLDGAREAMRQLQWPARAFPAWPCPVLRVRPGDGAGERLRREIERHKRVRGYQNALARDVSFRFEVLEDATDLDAWCRAFCDVHEQRWNPTATPSQYRAASARRMLRDVLQAWITEGVLVRFAVCLNGERVALVAALRAGTRLVYHHVATAPSAERARAGHVLIRLIGLWMSERGFDTLDFGAGGEAYKWRYATCDDRLWRVYAGRHLLSPGHLRGVAEEQIRRRPMLQQAWDAGVNRAIRGRATHWMRRTLSRLGRVVHPGAVPESDNPTEDPSHATP